MSLQVDQEMRRDLLLKALEACSNPDEALDMAIRMERFILEGQVSDKKQSREPKETGKPQLEEHRKTIARPRWTSDDDSLLRRSWENNLSVETIAEELHRTPASVYSRARHLGLSSHGREKTKSFRKAADTTTTV